MACSELHKHTHTMANQSKMAKSFFIGASANLSQLMSVGGLLKVRRRMELTLQDNGEDAVRAAAAANVLFAESVICAVCG